MPIPLVITPSGNLAGRIIMRGDIDPDQEERAEQCRDRQHSPIVRADHEPHRVGPTRMTLAPLFGA